jgi:hypothetical protein
MTYLSRNKYGNANYKIVVYNTYNTYFVIEMQLGGIIYNKYLCKARNLHNINLTSSARRKEAIYFPKTSEPNYQTVYGNP